MLHRAQPKALVKAVAYAGGVNDLSYFTRVFKRQFGVSRATSRWAQDCPSEWQDCPNALGLVGAKLGSHEGTDLRYHICVIARPDRILFV